MHLRSMQEAIADRDRATGWDLQPTALLTCHLAEEVGELIHCINQACGPDSEREEALAELPGELVDTAWCLLKIASRFAVDLDAGLQDLIERHSAWPDDPYHEELLDGLRYLDAELSAAKQRLDLTKATADH